MKVSAFTICHNSIRNQYPVIESIKSVVDKVDELIVVDGHSTDGTVEAIKNLKNDKIKIIQDKDTKWEDDWIYWRMGKNWARGFDECTGDWIIKFDTDYIFEDGYFLRQEFELLDSLNDDVYVLFVSRRNFQITNSYFYKNKKTLAVNKGLCKQNNIDVRWGYDLKNWGLCDEAIVYEKTENNLLQGKLLSFLNRREKLTICDVFNYGYCFRDEEIGKELMFRNMRAFYKQQGRSFKNKDECWVDYKRSCETYFKINKSEYLSIDEHPIYVRDRIKNLTPDKQGYNFWGKSKNNYYA